MAEIYFGEQAPLANKAFEQVNQEYPKIPMPRIVKNYITPQYMQRIDRWAQEEYGIPSIVLMENAGRCAAEEVLRTLSLFRIKRVACICGKGNNGGDGFVCARHLINQGVKVDVFLIGDPRQLKGDTRTNYEILKKMRAEMFSLFFLKSMALFKKRLRHARVIVDAVFGIGFKGAVQEPYKSVIKAMNEANKTIVSIDVPSGLDALTGRAAEYCVKATKTITFVLPKIGFIKKDGPAFVGKVYIKDISIPKALSQRR